MRISNLMKPKVLVVIGILAIMLFGFYLISRKDEKPPEIPSVKEQLTWKEIRAGVTTTNQLDELGEPKEKQRTVEGQLLYYQSENEYHLDEVETKGNKVVFIKEKMYSTSDRSLWAKIDTLGNSYTMLYGPNSNSGVNLFVYPEHGVAYLANQLGDLIFETWYFTPSTLEEFLSLPQLSGYSQEEFQRID